VSSRRVVAAVGAGAVIASGGLAAAAAGPVAHAPTSKSPHISRLPAGVAQAARRPEPRLAVPRGWQFPDAFSRTSGTGRLIDGALEWTDWVYDDYGAKEPAAPPNSITQAADSLSGANGSYVYPSGPAHNDGADIFRAAVALTPTATVWRVDWNTLADPRVPIAEWTFDTDNNVKTGRSAWPAGAHVSSKGIDRALVVTAKTARLIDVTTRRTLARFNTHVDRNARSFLVVVSRRTLPVSGAWRIRLAAGLADTSGTAFAIPTVSGNSPAATNAPRIYNVAFRSNAQEPSHYVAAATATAVQAAQDAKQTPVAGGEGVGAARNVLTSNYWAEADQADTLASGNISKFSHLVDWSVLAAHVTTRPPLLHGWSDRWYVTSLHLGQGVSSTTNADPAYLSRIEPYAVYVPTSYDGSQSVPLSWDLHSASVNYRQYGAVNPRLTHQFCENRGTICVTPEGFGANGLYMGDAENDFWSVWREVAQSFHVATDQTVVTGYSMGGLGSFTLPATYPSVFSESMPLDGGFDDRCTTAPAGAANFDIADAVDRSANIHWVPYVISDSYTDELSPYPNNAALVARLQNAQDRFTLFSTTMPEHITTDSADGFSTQVATLHGTPLVKTDPGTIDYTWCADVTNRKLGLGPSSVYWLSGLRQRTTSGNAVSRISANDMARPEQQVSEQLAAWAADPPDAPPMQVTTGSWNLEGAARPQPQLALNVTNVGAVTVDARAASLPTAIVSVETDGPSALTITGLRPGTVVYQPGDPTVTAGADGTVTLDIPSGASALAWSRG
jgi:hypothetical protein